MDKKKVTRNSISSIADLSFTRNGGQFRFTGLTWCGGILATIKISFSFGLYFWLFCLLRLIIPVLSILMTMYILWTKYRRIFLKSTDPGNIGILSYIRPLF